MQLPPTPVAAIIGAGPAGLMAAEVLVQAGIRVELFDAMPSVGRKFLMAGKGGMNITHAEALETFLDRYGARRAELEPLLRAFGPAQLRAWMQWLGIDSFVGSSGRVFPTAMKAAPLLRAWLHRLRGSGVKIHVRHRWLGWDPQGALRFATPEGERSLQADGVVLALGGGSWPQLGSTGDWVSLLAERGIPVAPLQPANCGFDAAWSEHFRAHRAGEAVKPVRAKVTDPAGKVHEALGEFNITATGVEGGLVYALSTPLRESLATGGEAMLYLDLAPGRELSAMLATLEQPRGKRSLSEWLRRRLHLSGVKIALLRECLDAGDLADPARLAHGIKALPLRIVAPRPIAEAISSAGGVPFEALDEGLMLRALPGVFCAGEMLDWEAPTGGYLLSACLATGRAAGLAAARWLAPVKRSEPD
ncbi:MAG: TIGR03862 family flavoprotein [Gammaproteobacteria bacterium]|nr:TIGR03862 family flavoprotein [Gammaproteobacteria bacterium]